MALTYTSFLTPASFAASPTPPPPPADKTATSCDEDHLGPRFLTPSCLLQLLGPQIVVGHSRLQYLSKSILRGALQTRRARQVFRRQVMEEVDEPAGRQMKGRLRLFQGPEVRRLHLRRLGKGYGTGDEAAVIEVNVVGRALQQPLDRIAPL